MRGDLASTALAHPRRHVSNLYVDYFNDRIDMLRRCDIKLLFETAAAHERGKGNSDPQ